MHQVQEARGSTGQPSEGESDFGGPCSHRIFNNVLFCREVGTERMTRFGAHTAIALAIVYLRLRMRGSDGLVTTFRERVGVTGLDWGSSRDLNIEIIRNSPRGWSRYELRHVCHGLLNCRRWGLDFFYY